MKKILILFILCFSLISEIGYGAKFLGLDFDRSLQNGYREYRIYNDGMTRTRYRVVLLPAGDEDITDCLEVYPKIVTVEPQSYKTYKIFGVAKRELEEKEYQFRVSFKPVVVPTIRKYEGKSISGSTSMGFSPEFLMKAYGGVIDYEKNLTIENLTFTKEDGKLVAKGRVINNSQGSFEIGMNFLDKKEKVLVSKAVGKIKTKSVLDIDIILEGVKDAKDIKYIQFYNDEAEELKKVELK